MRAMPQGPGSWWALPGPFQLVEAVADDLDQGRCVVVCLPLHLPTGFYEAVARQLTWCSGQTQRWRSPESPSFIDDADDALLELLYDRFGLQSEVFISDKSCSHLCCQTDFQGNRLLLRQLPATAVGRWCQFLATYQHELQNHQVINRTTFLLLLEGDATATAPTPDANLTVHRYGEHLTADDTRLLLRFAGARSAAANEPPLVKQLRQAVAVALAPADPMLALSLARQPMSTLLQPMKVLADYANGRGWGADPRALHLPEPEPAVAKALWAVGSWAKLENRPCLHAAMWALHERHDQIQSLVWEGQLAVLMPFLEHRRHCLLSQYKSELESLLPHTKIINQYRNTTVHELAELELGDLFFLRTEPVLARHRSFSAEVAILRHCRIELAHLRVVSEDYVNRLGAL